MQTPPLKQTLLSILILMLSSCAPPATPELTSPIEQAPTSAPTLPNPKPTRPSKGPTKPQGGDASQPLNFDIPAHSFDVILGRPTATSVTLSLLSSTSQTVTIAYGVETGNYTSQSSPITLTPNVPSVIQLSDLQPGTQYFYSISGAEHTFHTARAPGSTFTFTVQADSHLDSNSSLPVYLQAIENQRADRPDFVIDLGDTFMTDKVKPYTAAEPQYWAQRYYLSLIGQTAPVFLVLGNHDGEGAPKGGAGKEMSAWSAGMRTMLFPNPVPDGFYSGNNAPDPAVGALQDYYAWEWGDALFVVLDPYWFTPPQRGDSSLWTPTLGETQYQWLKSSLETSRAPWKFVFIHQLLSGTDRNGRGGVEVAPFYEWGGHNPDGSYGFDEQRPGWGKPIHQLLVENHVSAVFHGHDHLFARQELDGIVYQEVPQPNVIGCNDNLPREQGYLQGDIFCGAGHLAVRVGPSEVTVDLVRASLPSQTGSELQNGAVVFSYRILPR